MRKRYSFGSMALVFCLTGAAMAEDTGSAEQPSTSQPSQSGSQGQSAQSGSQQQSGQSASPGQSSQSASQAGAESGVLGRLSLEQRRQLQRELQSRGHYQGKIDGIIGPMTRAALDDFQRQQGMSAGGELDQQTLAALGLDLERQPVRGAGEPVRQPVAGAAGTMETPVELATLGEDRVRQLQQRLSDLGHYRGEVDGVAGGMTRAALQAYFRAQAELAGRGMLNESTLSALGVQSGERSAPGQGTMEQPGTSGQGTTGQPGTSGQGTTGQPGTGTEP